MRDIEQAEFEELDRLLNDPDVSLQAARVWALADAVAAKAREAAAALG